MAALRYWVWLAMASGARSAKKVLDYFGSPEKAYFALSEDYRKLPDLSQSDIAPFLNKNAGDAVQAIEDCRQLGFSIVTIGDAAYPERLRNIYDPPLVLYVRGRLPLLDEEAAIAVAGTRKCTPYGLKMSERMGYELARGGCLVVTGLARGIDSAAATGALKAGGRVLGVVGSGLDIVYPPENAALFDDVCSVGAIISEYPPGSKPAARHFPARNRLLSGVSLGVVIIEAPKRSGALITAARALEQGRDVFAVPGNVDSAACEGSNALLREGAAPALSGLDVALEYIHRFPGVTGFQKTAVQMETPQFGGEKSPENEAFLTPATPDKAKKDIDIPENVEYIDLVKFTEGMSEDERAVCIAIGEGSVHADEIIRKSRLAAGEAMSILTMLEISGRVKQLPGKYFTLTK